MDFWQISALFYEKSRRGPRCLTLKQAYMTPCLLLTIAHDAGSRCRFVKNIFKIMYFFNHILVQPCRTPLVAMVTKKMMI